LVIGGLGNVMSAMHLGKPKRFYRGFNNLRHSPMGREILGVAGFMAGLGLHTLFVLPANVIFQDLFLAVLGLPITAIISIELSQTIALVFSTLAVSFGLFALYYMTRCYRIKARPFWNHYQVSTAFVGSFLSLGAILGAVVVVANGMVFELDYRAGLAVFGVILAAGIALEALGHIGHARDMNAAEHEGAAAHYIQSTTFGKTYILRNCLLGLSLLAALALLLTAWTGPLALVAWSLVALTAMTSSIISRTLFYILVIPTTMPGAFFWKNKGFEQHARDIGLANMPQVGVVPDAH